MKETRGASAAQHDSSGAGLYCEGDWAAGSSALHSGGRLTHGAEFAAAGFGERVAPDLRWATELCLSGEPKRIGVGVALFDELDDRQFLDREQVKSRQDNGKGASKHPCGGSMQRAAAKMRYSCKEIKSSDGVRLTRPPYQGEIAAANFVITQINKGKRPGEEVTPFLRWIADYGFPGLRVAPVVIENPND